VCDSVCVCVLARVCVCTRAFRAHARTRTYCTTASANVCTHPSNLRALLRALLSALSFALSTRSRARSPSPLSS
jgi:hypothetical protein